MIAKLSEQVKKALEQPETEAARRDARHRVALPGTRGAGRAGQRDTEYWGKVIKTRNITAD